MNCKLVLALALASVIAAPSSSAYAQSDEKEPKKPELVAQSDEKEPKKPELIV